jgi:hypothetical protein
MAPEREDHDTARLAAGELDRIAANGGVAATGGPKPPHVE